MSKPASKKVIGLFVIGAVALAVVAVLALGSGKFFKKTFKAVCYFEGSVGGLSIGAPVVFRGVKIGTVTDIVLRYDQEKVAILIPVFLEIEQHIKGRSVSRQERYEGWKRLIDVGLRARLEMQSIVTGQLQVGFDFYPGRPIHLVGTDPDYLEFPTTPTPFQELARKVEKIPIEEIFQKILSAVEGIERVVNSPEITATIRSINQASDEAKNLIQDVRKEVKPLSGSLQETVADVRNEVKSLSASFQETVKDVRGEAKSLSHSVQETVKDYGKVAQNVNGQIEPVAANLNRTMEEARRLLQNVDAQIAQLGPALKEGIGEIRGLARNIDGQMTSLSASAKGTLEDYGKLARDVDSKLPSIVSGLEKNLDELQRTLVKARESLAVLGEAFNENGALYLDLTQTLEELASGARSIRLLADYLRRNPESVIWGKEKSGGK